MASSHDGTCPRDLLQGLVPSCVPTFKELFLSKDFGQAGMAQWWVHLPPTNMVLIPLRLVNFKSSTAGAFAITFRILSLKNVTRGYVLFWNWYLFENTICWYIAIHQINLLVDYWPAVGQFSQLRVHRPTPQSLTCVHVVYT